LSEHDEHYQVVNDFLDDEDPDLTDTASVEFKIRRCPSRGRIFKLVRRLAVRYHIEAGIDRPPVPSDLITWADDNLPIEVRKVPLKAHHGTVWRLDDCWIVHLNSNDTAARQRFTLYHEIFHILAHCKATEAAPVFRKASGPDRGYFNELLADHFATAILAPGKLVKQMWGDVKDISQMATIFNVPKQLVWFVLKHQGLI
jgi:hypothetical protein